VSALTRLGFVGGTALIGAAAASTRAVPAPAAARGGAAAAEAATTVRPGTAQYAGLARGVNQRWVGTPDWIALPRSADQGGAPAPGRNTVGAYVNYAASDLKDLWRNRSGVSWPELHSGSHHARLREVKGPRDPGDVFRRALSVESARQRRGVG
jgi:hypothetical protein